jgi:predicted HD phosphohydrolase
METVGFTRMADGTADEYALLDGYEREYTNGTADRVLAMLAALGGSMGGYKISRLEHCLQSATLAERDGASEEMVMATLLHDIGDGLAPHNHSDFAAAVIKPFVSEKTYWVIRHHGLFQGYYYFHHNGGDRHARDRFKESPHYQDCIDFCERYDQCAFDPDYDTHPLEYFEDRVRAFFNQTPFPIERA